MNIKNYRASFYILICNPDAVEAQSVAGPLKDKAYSVEICNGKSELEQVIVKEPPHVIVLNTGDKETCNKDYIEFLKKRLPETHFIVLKSSSDEASVFELYDEELVYSILHFPFEYQNEILVQVDNALSQTLLTFLNEDLKAEVDDLKENPAFVEHVPAGEAREETSQVVEEVEEASPVPFSLGAVELDKFYEQLEFTDSVKSASQVFVNHVHEQSNKNILFFKYLTSYQSLVLSMAKGLDLGDYRGVGIDLNKINGLESKHFENFKRVPEFHQMINDIFQTSNYVVDAVKTRSKFHGVVVSFDTASGVKANFSLQFALFKKHLEYLTLQDKYLRVNELDEATQVLNRQSLLQKLTQEVSRARRTQLPVSFILLSVDNYKDMLDEVNVDVLERALKNVGAIISKNSRVNDFVGRVGSDEFAIVLPHTPQKGAAIKAERLRKIIERADFSRVLPNFPSLTLSIGASEYPSVSNDADDLVFTADEALYQIKSKGSNKVCLATPRVNFEPDFIVKEY